MWPLFIELIVSFYVKIIRKIFTTPGISFWLECGHPEQVSTLKTTTWVSMYGKVQRIASTGHTGPHVDRVTDRHN